MLILLVDRPPVRRRHRPVAHRHDDDRARAGLCAASSARSSSPGMLVQVAGDPDVRAGRRRDRQHADPHRRAARHRLRGATGGSASRRRCSAPSSSAGRVDRRGLTARPPGLMTAPSTKPLAETGLLRQMGRTLYDKIWDDHLVANNPDGTSLIYIDRHLVHEVTSPQAFEGLRMNKRKVRAPERTLAVVDHNVPTTDRTPAQSRSRERHPDRGAGREHRAISASNITTPSTSARASSTSSARSRALRCPA